MLLTTMATSIDLAVQRKNFAMPRATFQVLTLNGVTTVAATDNGIYANEFTT